MKSDIMFLKDDRDLSDDELYISDDNAPVQNDNNDSDGDDAPIQESESTDSDASFSPDSDDSSDDDNDDDNVIHNNQPSRSNNGNRHRNNTTGTTNNPNNRDSTSGQNEARASTSTARDDDDDEIDSDEDDQVIQAILKSKEIHRDHPPDIQLEDTLANICFHPINNLIALASLTGDVLMYKYNNEENQLTSTYELHEAACRDIKFNQSGTLLYSAGKDGIITTSDVETKKLTKLYKNAHENPIYSMTILDDKLFATGDDEGTVKLWDLRQKDVKPVFSLKEMEDFVSAMVTDDEKKFLVCASGDGTLTTLNLRAKKLHVRTEDYPQELTCLGLFRNGRKIMVGGNKGNLFLFNWGEFGLHSDEIPSLTKKAINCMIPITENIVVTGGEDKVLRATSIFPNRQLGIVGHHDLTVECLDICNNGSIIASYSYDNTVKFWNISYFETLNVHKPTVKGGKQKTLKHNLPSSKLENASDFFSDL